MSQVTLPTPATLDDLLCELRCLRLQLATTAVCSDFHPRDVPIDGVTPQQVWAATAGRISGSVRNPSTTASLWLGPRKGVSPAGGASPGWQVGPLEVWTFEATDRYVGELWGIMDAGVSDSVSIQSIELY